MKTTKDSRGPIKKNRDGKTKNPTERDNLLKCLEEQNCKKKARDEERRLAAERQAQAQNVKKLDEQRHYPEKLSMSREIFDACQAFLDDREVSDQFIYPANPRGAHLLFNGWGHKTSCELCWSRLFLRSRAGKPVLVYWAGFKWMAFPEVELVTPEQFAEMNHDYVLKVTEIVRKVEIYGMVRGKK